MKDWLQLVLIFLSVPALGSAIALLVSTPAVAAELFAWLALLWSGPMGLVMVLVAVLTKRKRRAVGGWTEDEAQLRTTFAVMYLRGDVLSGLLTLSDQRLRFSGHRFNTIPEIDYSFPLRGIDWVGLRRLGRLVPNSIGVRMADGRELRFGVVRRRLWCDMIVDALPGRIDPRPIVRGHTED